ncbi:hypothetical protein [Glycomyces tarimensis]
MLASDLLEAPVAGTDGRREGIVIDIRARTRPGAPALVVEGLVLSRRHIRLFGYDRGDEVGPGLFTRLARFLHRDTRYVPLSDVDIDTPGAVRLRVPWDELDPLSTH